MAGGPGHLALAAAGRAGLLPLHLEDARGAVIGLIEGDLHGLLHVPGRAGDRGDGGGHRNPLEEVTQVAAQVHVAWVGAPAPPEGPATGRLALRLLNLVGVLPLVAVAVVLAAFLGVGEDLVGGVDLLEARLGQTCRPG